MYDFGPTDVTKHVDLIKSILLKLTKSKSNNEDQNQSWVKKKTKNIR